jgi:uncharacterized protein YggT (Ycf19 family)
VDFPETGIPTITIKGIFIIPIINQYIILILIIKFSNSIMSNMSFPSSADIPELMDPMLQPPLPDKDFIVETVPQDLSY